MTTLRAAARATTGRRCLALGGTLAIVASALFSCGGGAGASAASGTPTATSGTSSASKSISPPAVPKSRTKTAKPKPTPTPSTTGSTPGGSAGGATKGRSYPLHTGIVSTTFWVGEIFDPDAEDGSQMISTYDSSWFAHYGGCDGVATSSTCGTEKRTAANDWFPTRMTPKQNPFYLDLPFDDLNDSIGFKTRCTVIPWANDAGYAGRCKDTGFSYMKNRWVKLTGPKGAVCYGQIADAGPGQYHDAAYVFGTSDSRPVNKKFNKAGADVSPALNGCLGFADLDGDQDKTSWQFVDDVDVPAGPWTQVITTAGVTNE